MQPPIIPPPDETDTALHARPDQAAQSTGNGHAADTGFDTNRITYLPLQQPKDPRAIRCDGSWFTNAVFALPLFPFFGTLFALLVYDYCRHSQPPSGVCGAYTLTATALALCLWCIASIVICGIAGASRADMANRRAYLHIASKLNAVYAQLRDSAPYLVPIQHEQPVLYAALPDEAKRRISTYNAACLQYNQACAALAIGGPQWRDGSGYINVSTILHRAEEGLFEFEDELAVLGDALYDYQRIETSTIDAGTTDALLNKIKSAIRAISPEVYQTNWGDNDEQGDRGSSAAARATLRMVRRTMNELRDGIRGELVRVRAQSVYISVFLGSSIFILVIVGILVHQWSVGEQSAEDARIIVGPLIFFLIAATTGLVYRLYSDSKAEGATNIKGSEDSDLTDVPFQFAPLVSGIAGIGGIVVTGGLATISAGMSGRNGIESLFDPAVLGQSVITAAAFGIAPGLLFDRLAQYTDSLKKDLQASSAAPQTGTPGQSKNQQTGGGA
jgi:hypothetical protein